MYFDLLFCFLLKKNNTKCWELDFLTFCRERERERERKKEGKKKNYAFYAEKKKVKIHTCRIKCNLTFFYAFYAFYAEGQNTH